MKYPIVYTEIAGRLVIGELSRQQPALLEVTSLYPFYGLKISAKPKMCMLFSKKSYGIAGKKILATVYHLNRRLNPKREELKTDFIDLQQKTRNSSPTEKEALIDEFKFTYLNGFKGNPEFIFDPLPDLLSFLNGYFEKYGNNTPLRIKTQVQKNGENILPKNAAYLSLEQKLSGFVTQIKSGIDEGYYQLLSEDFVI